MARGVFSPRQWNPSLSPKLADYLLFYRIEVPVPDILVTKIAFFTIWNKNYNQTSLKKRILYS